MALFSILEPLIAILVIGFLLSQTLAQEFLGQPWFPIFRRGWKLRKNIAEAKEDKAADALAEELKKIKGDDHDAGQPQP